MKRKIDNDRLNNIKELLFAIAEGDLNYQIERSQEDDELESLVVILNWLTEELNESLKFLSSLNTRGKIDNFIHIEFILNSDFNLIGINKGALMQLGISKNKIIGKSFSSLLHKESQQVWNKVSEAILKQPEYTGSHKFQFASDTPLKKLFLCDIHCIPPVAIGSQLILISCFQPISNRRLIESKVKLRKMKEALDVKLPKPKPKIMLTHEDVKMVQEVRDFILQNLDQPLPSIQELARKHGTNDFKLKKVFSQFYSNSIFRYYTEERVKKAAIYLKNTRVSIEDTAKLSGFTNTAHFSTAFKKYYSVSPTVYRKLYNQNFK